MALSPFYDVTEHFAKRFDAVGRQLAFRGRTRRDADVWQKKLAGKLRELLGLDTFTKTRLRPRLRCREDRGSYWREDWTIDTEPDVVAPFYALIPKGANARQPAVICPHGHASGGRLSPAGRRDIKAIAQAIKTYNYDYAVQLTRRGFVTFAMDARGFGQRRVRDRQTRESFLHGSCHALMLMGHSLGQTVAGMWVWDLMRLVDYIATRREVDAARIGCAGLSGGGLQTLYLAALDQRIQAAVVSGYFYGVKDSLLRQAQHCDCNCIPHLWENADLGDIGGLIAPRGLFVETGNKDPLNGRSLANVTSQVGSARKVYRAFQSSDQLVHHVFPGKHRWCGERSEPWLAKQLRLK